MLFITVFFLGDVERYGYRLLADTAIDILEYTIFRREFYLDDFTCRLVPVFEYLFLACFGRTSYSLHRTVELECDDTAFGNIV